MDKREFIGRVGCELVRRHGKWQYYQPADVSNAAGASGLAADLHRWAFCIFTSPADFQALHDAKGEACDYVAIRAEMLADLAGGSSSSWLDLSLSWLDWPDIELPSIFDWFDYFAVAWRSGN